MRARPVALKRALANLVAQRGELTAASARVHAGAAVEGTVAIDDRGRRSRHPATNGPRVRAVPPRLEHSRNRETGGVGLGLPIARNILRAHGGDVVLSNRPKGGLRALVTLPV